MMLADEGSSSLLTFGSRSQMKLSSGQLASSNQQTIDQRRRRHSNGRLPSWSAPNGHSSSSMVANEQPAASHYPVREDLYHEPHTTWHSDVHLIDELDFGLEGYAEPTRGRQRHNHRYDTQTNDLHCDESSRLSLRSSQQQASSFVYQDDEDDGDDQHQGDGRLDEGRSFASLALSGRHQPGGPHLSLPFEQQHHHNHNQNHQFHSYYQQHYHDDHQYQAYHFPEQSHRQRGQRQPPTQRSYQRPPTSFSGQSQTGHRNRKLASSSARRRQSAGSEQATESLESTSNSGASHYGRQLADQLASSRKDSLLGSYNTVDNYPAYNQELASDQSAKQKGWQASGQAQRPNSNNSQPTHKRANQVHAPSNKMDNQSAAQHRRTQRPAQGLSFCGKLAKLLLFVANILFWSTGIALGSWGILSLIEENKYNLSQLLVYEPSSRMSLFQLLSWSYITLGCATTLVGFCGCSAIFKNNRWILGLYIFLILAIFALDLATGLLAIIFQERLVANMRLRLTNKLRSDYGLQASFTAAMDYIQTKYQCCGLEGHFDYDQSNWRLQRLGGFDATVARTCCHLRNTLDDQAHINPRPVNESMCQSSDVRFHQSYRYRKGCLDDLESLVRHKIWTFTVGCGLAGAAILLSLLFATCFCRSIPVSSSTTNSKSKTGTQKSNSSSRSHKKLQLAAQQTDQHSSNNLSYNKTNNLHNQARQHHR